MATLYRIYMVRNNGSKEHISTTHTETQAEQAKKHYQQSIPKDIDGKPTAKITIEPVTQKSNQW